MAVASRLIGSFAVADLQQARDFYQRVLELGVEGTPPVLELRDRTGARFFVYEKPDHQPAGFTVLKLMLPDIAAAVGMLRARGVRFDVHADGPLQTDADGIHRDDCATIAWFRDPSGNYMALIEDAGPVPD